MQNIINKVEKTFLQEGEALPEIHSGDIINVHLKITERNKERIQQFQGTVVKIQGKKAHIRMVTVRKLTNGIGVERIFPIPSPVVVKVEVKRKAMVRRANLSYLREKKGTKTNIRYKISKK